MILPIIEAEDFHAGGEGPDVAAALALIAAGGLIRFFLAGGGGEDEGFAVGREITAGVAGFFGGDADGGVDGGRFAFDQVQAGR